MAEAPDAHRAPADAPQWRELERSPEFQRLLAAKRRFIAPATVFFIVYYFSLPLLVGYFPDAMSTDVYGELNVAYLFALSQFVMTWGLMWMYIRRAREFDADVERIAAGTLGGGR